MSGLAVGTGTVSPGLGGQSVRHSDGRDSAVASRVSTQRGVTAADAHSSQRRSHRQQIVPFTADELHVSKQLMTGIRDCMFLVILKMQ